MSKLANMKPALYVVLVWMYDHWGVTYETDDLAEAEKVRRQASERVRAILVPTEAPA